MAICHKKMRAIVMLGKHAVMAALQRFNRLLVVRSNDSYFGHDQDGLGARFDGGIGVEFFVKQNLSRDGVVLLAFAD